ncbi:MAG: T9SS type A sorting domain-containing protein, partial [Bacteroidia bacterium]|nr:T9SS type A sorting domain-containing protein [Bacteroidia bacterium]
TSFSTGKFFKLTADIDLGGTIQWTPIGINGTNLKFAGVFDGNNRLISNLFYNGIVNLTNSYVGLFGYIAGASIGSAVVKNTTITGSITGANFVGGLAGRADNVIFWNCTNGASVKGSTGVSGATYVGGIVGRLGSGSTIAYCSNQGFINGVADHAGGIVGNAAGGSIAAPCLIQFCSNSGNVTGNTLYVGGITGNGGGQITIDQCFNTASILSVQGASGGIDGYGGDATAAPGTLKTVISNCYNTGSVNTTVPKTSTGNPYTSGGILGYTAAKWYYTISNCYNTGSVANTAGAQAILGFYVTAGAPAGWANAPTNCFYDNLITASATNGGTGLATADLQANAGVLNNGQTPVIWISDATSINGGMPILAWQLKPVPVFTAIPTTKILNSSLIYALNKTIHVDLKDCSMATISVYDVKGTLLKQQRSVQSSFETTVCKSGVYLVRIVSGTQTFTSKTIVL